MHSCDLQIHFFFRFFAFKKGWRWWKINKTDKSMRILIQLFIQYTISTFASFCIHGLTSHKKCMAENIYFFPYFHYLQSLTSVSIPSTSSSTCPAELRVVSGVWTWSPACTKLDSKISHTHTHTHHDFTFRHRKWSYGVNPPSSWSLQGVCFLNDGGDGDLAHLQCSLWNRCLEEACLSKEGQ